jgi:hypothetical protein
MQLPSADTYTESDNDSSSSSASLTFAPSFLYLARNTWPLQYSEPPRTDFKSSVVKAKGICLLFMLFFKYFIQNLFIWRPSDSTVSADAGTEPKTVAILALAFRRSYHSPRLHYMWRNHSCRIFFLCCLLSALRILTLSFLCTPKSQQADFMSSGLGWTSIFCEIYITFNTS